ncbi:MAG TPA: addiction module protein [Verrucomicrobiae bacterium]
MSLTIDQLTEEAMQLPSSSRALLAERLVESLDATEMDEMQKLWATEAVRRRDEVRSGQVQAIPGEQVLAELIIAVAHGSREPGYWRQRLHRSD